MSAQTSSAPKWIAYLGTYTHGASRRIYSLQYEPSTGTFTPVGLAAPSVSPSFLTLHPNGRFLYAVNESRRYNGIANSGSISAFSIDPASGNLTQINIVPSRGADPCHLMVDRTGRWLIVANYSGSSIAVLPIAEDGAVGEVQHLLEHQGSTNADPVRQEAPHPHSINISPDNRFVYVSDLGKDQLLVYSFDASTGELRPHGSAMVAEGSGPRNPAFSRDGRYVYLMNELSATVTVFRHDPENASFEEVQTTSTLPRGFRGPRSGAAIAIDPSGRFLYASNRGHDSLAIFSIDAEQGLLTSRGQVSTQGRTPRHFAITPDGAHLIVANQDSDSLAVFSIDQDTGALTLIAEPPSPHRPVCVLFVPLP